MTALRLREVSAVRHDVLHLPPEREAGVAGYAAGLTDAEGQPRAKHRATPAAPKTFHDEVVRTTKDLDTMIAQAGVTGTGEAAHRIPANLPPVPDTPAGAADEATTAEEKRR